MKNAFGGSTTAVGNRLEHAIADLLGSEIAAGRFWAKKACCKVRRKASYYSDKRKRDITFDVAVEVRLPGAASYSYLVLFECKNYTHAVPVDDAEEFLAKVNQVGELNTKAVLASTASFQSGTLQFAKSTGMGLLRYFNADHFKWELYRSASGGGATTTEHGEATIADGLTQANFQSETFDVFLQSPLRLTNSLWKFFDDLAGPNQALGAAVTSRRDNERSTVPYRDKASMEQFAERVLADISYKRGAVSLADICFMEGDKKGLRVELAKRHAAEDRPRGQLGRIQFDPLLIEVYEHAAQYPGRERFTLAHELAHHLLGHGQFMRRECCDEEDFAQQGLGPNAGTDIARMEYQANYVGACLLMPRSNFIADLVRELRKLDLHNKGFGAVFVDNQECNLESYHHITTALMLRYQVSRSAVAIRLTGLGLLRDVRARRGADIGATGTMQRGLLSAIDQVVAALEED